MHNSHKTQLQGALKWDKDLEPPLLGPGFIPAFVFLFLFILFVYGALFVALLGLSDWIIHAQHFSFFLHRGTFGIVLFALCLVFGWIGLVALISFLFYRGFLFFGKKALAQRVALIIIFSLFHIFAFPWILWPILRNASPRLRKRHQQKLRLLARARRKQKAFSGPRGG